MSDNLQFLFLPYINVQCVVDIKSKPYSVLRPAIMELSRKTPSEKSRMRKYLHGMPLYRTNSVGDFRMLANPFGPVLALVLAD